MARARRHGVRYPWDKWFNLVREGKAVTLVRGTHFEGLPHGMASMCRAAMVRERIRLSIRTLEDRIVLTLNPNGVKV